MILFSYIKFEKKKEMYTPLKNIYQLQFLNLILIKNTFCILHFKKLSLIEYCKLERLL